MNIREGFVSNSSSTSYIVCIDPDDKMANWKEAVNDAYKEESQWFDENPPYALVDLMASMKRLQDGQDIVERSDGKFNIMGEIMDDLDIVIKSKEVGDLDGRISNICTPDCYDKIKSVL